MPYELISEKAVLQIVKSIVAMRVCFIQTESGTGYYGIPSLFSAINKGSFNVLSYVEGSVLFDIYF